MLEIYSTENGDPVLLLIGELQIFDEDDYKMIHMVLCEHGVECGIDLNIAEAKRIIKHLQEQIKDFRWQLNT